MFLKLILFIYLFNNQLIRAQQIDANETEADNETEINAQTTNIIQELTTLPLEEPPIIALTTTTTPFVFTTIESINGKTQSARIILLNREKIKLKQFNNSKEYYEEKTSKKLNYL
jgi:hypothetical protein